MMNKIKAALEVAKMVLEVATIVTTTGEALISIFDKNNEKF